MIKETKVKRNSNLLRMVFFSSIILVCFLFFLNLRRLVLPLCFSYILSFLAKPSFPFFSKFGINRTFTSIIIILSFGVMIVYPVIMAVPAIKKEADNLQYYLPKFEKFARKKFSEIKARVNVPGFEKYGDRALDSGINLIKDGLKSAILGLPSILGTILEWFFLVPLFLFFLFKDGKNFKYSILKLVPNSIFERVYSLMHKFNKQLGDYIFAKFVEATIVGVIITTGLVIIDLRFAIILGLVAAITNIIPYVGPILGFVPAIIIGLIEYGGLTSQLGAVIVLYSLANAIDLGLVFPILVSKIVDLHPIIVVVSVVLGSQMMGIMGMVVSIPFAAAFKLLFQEFYFSIYPSGPTQKRNM